MNGLNGAARAWHGYVGRSAIRSRSRASATRLLAQLESPRWAEVADRCLACANCTLVCPTCFCTSVSQRSDLDGVESVAVRGWDSCFSRRLRQGGRRQLPVATRRSLPAVADAQVRDVDRSVRNVRLRRLRPLHHLVSGRHRCSRGACCHCQPATGADSPAGRCRLAGCVRHWPHRAHRSRDGRYDHAGCGRRPADCRGPAWAIRDGHAARPACRADLDLALPPRRQPDRAVDPGGGPRHRDPWPAGNRRRARSPRSARPGLARRGRRGPRRHRRGRRDRAVSVAPACRRAARGARPVRNAFACTTGRGRRKTGRTFRTSRRGLAGGTSTLA